jgi:hypothetical protein
MLKVGDLVRVRDDLHIGAWVVAFSPCVYAEPYDMGFVVENPWKDHRYWVKWFRTGAATHSWSNDEIELVENEDGK